MMMPLSTIPLLFAAQIGFLALAAMRARTAKAFAAATIIAVVLLAWGFASAAIALGGVYDSGGFLRLLPGLWLPAVPFVVVLTTFVLPVVRTGLSDMLQAVPADWFVGIQALRIAALGTLIKTIQGDFPLEVELAIGLTDLAFGLSAVWMFVLARCGSVSADALAIWHLVGVLIILMPGELVLQTGLPGPLRVFTEYPTSEVMLDWPMALAPSLVVPCFLLLNIFGAVAAFRSHGLSNPGKDTLS